MGHLLFKSSAETFPVPLIVGDVFDPSILDPVPPFNNAPQTPIPSLSSLKSLNPLAGHVSVIHATLFFHLFGGEKELQLARGMAGLLSPEPGSVILGTQVGSTTKKVSQSSDGANFYLHSPESWKELWTQVFGQGMVEIETVLKPLTLDVYKNAANHPDSFVLFWSVTRI
jgi:hypothetical protein